MAQKILLFLLITFCGRSLQKSQKLSFPYIQAKKGRYIYSNFKDFKCSKRLSQNLSLYRSLNCFLNSGRSFSKGSDLNFVLLASKKHKPKKRSSLAYIVLPLKNWGRLYFTPAQTSKARH